MEKKHYLILDDDFIQYCKLNNITDIEKKAKEVFSQGFNLLKYGNNPIENGFKKIEPPQLKNLENLKNPTKINEGKEKSNNKVVTTPRPNAMPAPQKPKKDDLYD